MLVTCQWVNAARTWRGEMHTGFVGRSLKTSAKGPSLYCCTVHLDINVYVYQLMRIVISLREH